MLDESVRTRKTSGVLGLRADAIIRSAVAKRDGNIGANCLAIRLLFGFRFGVIRFLLGYGFGCFLLFKPRVSIDLDQLTGCRSALHRCGALGR